MRDELTSIQRRAALFISERDPFGDHFSPLDLAQLDPNGGYTTVALPPRPADDNLPKWEIGRDGWDASDEATREDR